MRRVILTLGLLLALSLAKPQLVAAAAWNGLYAFGDSYSDSGAGYVDGNGPTAIANAARELRIPFTYRGDPGWQSEGLNFSVSGAQTGAGEGQLRGEIGAAGARRPLLGRGVATQVGDFVALAQIGKLHFDPDHTLFFLAAGLNHSKLTTAATTANLVAARLNPAVAALPAQLRTAVPGIHVGMSQWGPYFDDVTANAARYGITDTTGRCAGREIFQEDTRPCADPDAHYFYHSDHPSRRVHELVGHLLATELMAADATPNVGERARTLAESALYEGDIPGAKSTQDTETVRNGFGFNSAINVSRPTYTVYLPAAYNASGAAVLVFPGGGYTALSIEMEGKLVAEWLQNMGVAAIVVKYRLPSDATMIDKAHGPLQDAQRALLLAREHAAEWGFDPHRVGVMGFSAGGHLAASAGTHFRNLRPDFMILVYPVITMNAEHAHAGSRNALLGAHPDAALVREFSNELQVSAGTPPTLLLCAGDDSVVDVENTLGFYRALQQHGVAATLHMFQIGRHGFPLLPRAVWLAQVQDWLELRGLARPQR